MHPENLVGQQMLGFIQRNTGRKTLAPFWHKLIVFVIVKSSVFN